MGQTICLDKALDVFRNDNTRGGGTPAACPKDTCSRLCDKNFLAGHRCYLVNSASTGHICDRQTTSCSRASTIQDRVAQDRGLTGRYVFLARGKNHVETVKPMTTGEFNVLSTILPHAVYDPRHVNDHHMGGNAIIMVFNLIACSRSQFRLSLVRPPAFAASIT
jgi:hypothetical protein